MTDVPTPDSLGSGSRVGPWCLEWRAGSGTYGVVFRAHHAEDPESKPVALKVSYFPGDPRHEREVALLSRIRHPAIPELVDRGGWRPPGGPLYPIVVMQWVEGLGLYEWAEIYDPTSRQVLRVLAQVARALEAVHAAGCVHRDVKGDNLLLRPDGRAWLMDFGAGTWAGAPLLTDGPMPPGTRAYRGPEALRFNWHFRRHPSAHYQAGPADDVYALGVTIYRLVTGTYPPPGTDPQGRHDRRRPPPLKRLPPQALNACVAPELVALIERMLAPVPQARPGARELAEAAEAAVERAGPEADLPLRAADRARAEVSTERAPPSTSRPERSELLPYLGSLLVGFFLALGVWWGVHCPSIEAPAVAQGEARDGGSEDGGTAGMGEEVLTAVVGSVMHPSSWVGLGLDMPRKPFPGQLKSDRNDRCPKQVQVAVNGGCWIALRDLRPPCGDEGYEWKGGCYYPVFDVPRQPTSDQP